MAAIVLGTVQLGLDYGVANAHGKPSAAQARDLVAVALRRGVTVSSSGGTRTLTLTLTKKPEERERERERERQPVLAGQQGR